MFSIKSFSIFVILFSVISLIIIFTIPRLKKKQKNIIQSLQEGYGYYGKEESLGCFSSDGKCTGSGVETIVQYCKPHPATGRGCFRNNKMTYETIVRKKPCRLQCYSSNFLIQDGIQVNNPTEVYDGTSFINTVVEIGCNKIIDKRYGVDYTDYFLGNLFSDDDGNKRYLLNYCIPNGTDSDYQGYYERIFSCVEKDSKGESLCNYTCGNEKGKLIFSGINKEGLEDNSLIYYPYETNSEGEKLFYCYNLNNKNQVELLNYSDEIPEDFVYPEICYKHVNVFDFNEKLWPNTNDNTVFDLTKDQISRNVSYIDILPDQYSKFDYITTGVSTIISRDYDLNKDSESYVKLRFGNEIAILDKIYDIVDTGIDVKSSRKINRDDNNIESKFMYLALSGGSDIGIVSSGIKNGINTESDFAVMKENGESASYTLLGKKGQTFYDDNVEIYKEQFYFEDSNHLYFPCNFSDLFDYSPNKTNIIYNGVSTIIQNDGITTSGTSYYYMVNKGVSLPYNQVKFLKGVNVAGSHSAFFEGDIFDEHNSSLDSLYVYNNRAPLIEGTTIKVAYDDDNKYSIDLSKSFMTFNVLTKQFQDRIEGYDFVEMISNKEINLSDKNKAYSVLGSPTKNGIQAYYYPMYLSDNNNSRDLVKFTQFPKVDFYQERNDSSFSLSRPEKFKNKDLAFFNDEILFSSATFEKNFIEIGTNKKYFISELNTINHGMCYFKREDQTNIVYPLFSSVGSSFNNLINNVSTESGTFITSAISYKKAGTFGGSRTIKIVRGNSLLVKSLQTNPFVFSDKMEKIKLYYEMIKEQGFSKDYDEELIFEPEKYLSVEADFSVFKSPYVFNSDGTKNFFCYKDNGTPLPNGTVVNFDTLSSDIYLNLTCPNDNISYEVGKVDRSGENPKVVSIESPYCGVKGIKQVKDLNKDKQDQDEVLGFCVQDIDAVEVSFTNNLETCNIIKDKNKYNSLKSQLESGLKLNKAIKSKEFNEEIKEDEMTFPSYFTRIFKPQTLYSPGEDFFFEKSRDNYYYSTINNNTAFFDDFTNWRRIFTYNDNILVSAFQNFFNIFPKRKSDSTLSLGLGKFLTTFTGLKKIDSMNMYSSFSSNNYGITTQNYLNYGITPYWGNQIKPLRDANIRYGQKITFMQSLQDSLFRRNYNSNTFELDDPKPIWSSLKLRKTNNGLNFERGSPIDVFFSFVKIDDEFLFSSRFYDTNLNFPWASDVEVGDFFNPDLTYFNYFFYTFILFDISFYGLNVPGIQTDKIIKYGTPGKGVLYDNFLLREQIQKIFPSSIDNFKFSGPLVNHSINVYESSLVELSDFILFLPISYYKSRSSSELIYDSENFPKTYPTFEIRRVSKITKTPNADGKKTIFFERKNYSSSNPSQITSKTKYYLFNIGKSSGYNDLISRNFRIVRKGDFNYTNKENNSVTTIKKKYIEFFFSIESISQESMSLLYESYVSDVGKVPLPPGEIPEDEKFYHQLELTEFFFISSFQNVMTPALSARYIKSEIKIPSQPLFGNTSATLSNATSQDILNTKIMSMTTKFRKLGNVYYISEFRENSDYFTPTVDRVFELGDTFKYYNLFFDNSEFLGPKTGSKQYIMTLELRVVDVDVTLVDTFNGQNLVNIYDYKCEPVINNFNYGKKIFGTVNTSEIYQTSIESSTVEGNFNFEYQLPHTGYDTVTGLHTRVVVKGITNDFKIKCKDLRTNTMVYFEKDNLFLDYYKFHKDKVNSYVNPPNYGVATNLNETSLANLLSPSIDTKKTLKISTIYSGNAIRSGLLDFMVLTSTSLKTDNNNSETYKIDVEVVGKPYGTECFISEPSPDSVPNYEGFGKITKFSLADRVFPAGTTLKSSKGFQIKIIGKEPASYSFLSVVSPYSDIPLYREGYNYGKQEIVTFKNLNKRQYFRNNSPFVLPYIENPDPSNVNVPYAVKDKDTNTWFYPLFVKSKEGREEIKTIDEINFFYSPGELYNLKSETNTTQYMDYSFTDEEKIFFLESFSPVPRTIYPKDNFLQYNSDAIYTLGQIVITKVDNVNTLFKSLKEINVGNQVSDLLSWEIVLNFENFITGDFNNFYSKLVPSSDYSNYVNDLKNINNQHLPALISKYNGDEFCPQPCTYYDTKDNYSNTFLETSYFKSIKYIFENPIILNVDGTSTVVSLSNSPVESPQQYILDYDINFFQNGGGRNSVLSQYLYFINIRGQEKKFGKNLCTGDLFVTKETGPSINTGIDKFTFSNSLLFNFIPCDEDGQDFIKYDIDSNYNSTAHGSSILLKVRDDYVLSSHRNQFPPNGVSCNVLVSSKNGGNFRPIYGYFSHDYIVKDDDSGSNITGTSFSLTGITRGEIIEGTDTGFCYGDVWYNKIDKTESYTSGFVVPEVSLGKIDSESFIYLTENKNDPISEIKFLEESLDFNVIKEENKIRTFKIDNFTDYKNYTTKIYSVGTGTSIYLETLNGEPLQQNQSFFFTDDTIEEGEVLYLPTYDITKNIKAKTYSIFGHNFLGDITYGVGVSESHYSLDDKKLSPAIFTQSKNDLLRSDRINEGVNLFLGSENSYTPAGEKVFLINFEGGKFSIKPNLYTKPVVNKDSKLLYLENTTVRPTYPLAAIDTENTTTFIAKGLSNIKGISIQVNLHDYLNFNTNYTSDGIEIPGETNIQLQLREIRQNYLDYYIQENDNCSLYFQPPVGIRILRQEAAKLSIKISTSGYYNSYNSTESGDRFFGTFKNSNMFLDYQGKNTLELGCNLLYLIDQTDGSNNEPMVFSKSTWDSGNFTNPGNTIDMGPPNNQTFVIKYFLDGENVSYEDYLAKGNFSNEKNSVERLIEILYKSDFDINDTNNNDFSFAIINYGTPNKGIAIGGKLHFNYH